MLVVLFVVSGQLGTRTLVTFGIDVWQVVEVDRCCGEHSLHIIKNVLIFNELVDVDHCC